MRKAIIWAVCLGITFLYTAAPASANGNKPADAHQGGQLVGQMNFCQSNWTSDAQFYFPKHSFVARPNQSGEFCFYHVPPGTYSLVFDFGDDIPPFRLDGIQILKNEITTLDPIDLCRDTDMDGEDESTDCDDGNPNVNSNAEELCDGIDNNCNMQVDEGCDLCIDSDNDGFFVDILCGTLPDCDDTEKMTNPAAPELCDMIDNDCDLVIDEDFDTGSDPNNCGDCGNVCSFANASSLCQEGICILELCAPGFDDCDFDQSNGCEADLSSDADHCGACGIVCLSNELCDNGVCRLDCVDQDQDGVFDAVCGGTDCDDNDPNTFPGAEEICDTVDNDCNGIVDDGTVCGCPPGFTDCGGICLDLNNDPDHCGACNDACQSGELCANGTCVPQCPDTDNDGFPDAVCGGNDCDDNDPNSFPGAPEICEDGLDNDCDGVVDNGGQCLCPPGEENCFGICVDLDTDESHCGACSAACVSGEICEAGQCQTDCPDADNDGFTDAACGGLDCADGDPDIFPGAMELCNGIDDDCDSVTDEDLGTGGSCSVGTGACQRVGVLICQPDGSVGCSAIPGPPEEEICDSIDNDCDGTIDEDAVCQCPPGEESCFGLCIDPQSDPAHCGQCGNACGSGETCQAGTCVPDCPDVDGDGFDNAICGGLDCNDSDPNINPSAAEQCNGVDDNCDGVTDEQCTCTDGQIQICYSGPSGTEGVGLCRGGTQLCSGGTFGTCEGEITPDPEVCDGLDNDCDGTIDEGITCGVCGNDMAETGEACDGTDLRGQTCQDFGHVSGTLACTTTCELDLSNCHSTCPDLDADGFFDAVCGGNDCNDNSDSIYPGAPERCNGIDDNCDGVVDEPGTCAVCGDGIVDPGEVCDGADLNGQTCVSQGFEGGTLSCSAACNAFDTSGCFSAVCGNNTAEGAEICDGTDLRGLGCTDLGFSGGTLSCSAACDQYDVSGCTGTVCPDNDGDGFHDAACGGLDCNDGNPTIFPNAPERCNGIDDNCNGEVDEAFGLGDTCSAGVGACVRTGAIVCQPNGTAGCSAIPGPPSAETCNGIDDDCDGVVDEDFDLQTDPNNCGACTVACTSGQDCVSGLCTDSCPDNDGDGFPSAACGGTDCNDSFPEVNPAAPEICNDFDDNCNGQVDEGLVCGTCGNNVAEPGETCDGLDLRGFTCDSLGFLPGSLSCTADCTQFNTSNCGPAI